LNLNISTNTKDLSTINYTNKIITPCSNNHLKKYRILPNRRRQGTKSNSWDPFGRNNTTKPNDSCSCFVLTMVLLCRLMMIQRICQTRSVDLASVLHLLHFDRRVHI